MAFGFLEHLDVPDEESRRVLLRRLRQALWIVLGSISCFAISDWWLTPERIVPLYAVKAVQVSLVGFLFVALGWPEARERPVLLGLTGVAIVCFTTAASSIVNGEFETTGILFLVVVLLTGTLFPWGVMAQVLAVSAAALAYGMSAVVVGNGISAIATYPTVGLLVGFGTSVYIARELDRARQERRRVERMRSDFVAMLSHDIRNPLAIIEGFVEVLLGRVDADERDRLMRIGAAARKALLLATNFLDETRIRDGKMAIQARPVDLAAILEQVVVHERFMAAARGIRLEQDFGSLSAPLEGDEALLERAFTNLVNNAIKYTPRGGTVRIRATSAGGDGIEVVVEDTGPGLPEGVPLFERFAKTEERRDSTGLGLFIVKTIAEAHGGRATASNRTDRPGARFRVELPLSRGTAG